MNHVLLTLLSGEHVLLIVVVVVLLFGGKKIPELMKGVGQGIREFKDGMNGQSKSEPKNYSKDNNQDKPLF